MHGHHSIIVSLFVQLKKEFISIISDPPIVTSLSNLVYGISEWIQNLQVYYLARYLTKPFVPRKVSIYYLSPLYTGYLKKFL